MLCLLMLAALPETIATFGWRIEARSYDPGGYTIYNVLLLEMKIRW